MQKKQDCSEFMSKFIIQLEIDLTPQLYTIVQNLNILFVTYIIVNIIYYLLLRISCNTSLLFVLFFLICHIGLFVINNNKKKTHLKKQLPSLFDKKQTKLTIGHFLSLSPCKVARENIWDSNVRKWCVFHWHIFGLSLE